MGRPPSAPARSATRLFDPYRHMFAARAGERLPPEPAPALAEAHPRQLGHQVQLGRPDVAEWNRAADRAPVGCDLEVVGDQTLIGDVVLVEADVLVTDMERDHGLPRREPLE